MRLFGFTDKQATAQPVVNLQLAGAAQGFPQSLLEQTFLGKYQIRRFLGEGSNAHVFLAKNIETDERVVVKRIKESATQSPRFQQFFEAEVRSMANFVHPYVVKLIDASINDPLGACLVLEYIQGVTLESLLDQERRFSADRVARFVGPLAHALYAAQKLGIVHRDLKPANLMVVNPGTEQESIRVMDFGFASFSAKPHIQLAELTGHGSIVACGTPAYVSPEMIRGDSTDARADIYSVGVILFELLTGRLPFEYESQEKLLDAHVKENPPRFHRIGAQNIPLPLEAVIQNALAKYPSERQQSMKELAQQYARAIGWDIWEYYRPKADMIQTPMPEISVPSMADLEMEPVSEIDERFILSDVFEACFPEKLAALKLRGFIEEVKGQVVESEPGLIRVRVDLPSGWKEPNANSRSGVFAFLSGTRRCNIQRGREPIEIELRMNKLDTNRVSILLAFRPLKWHIPTDIETWQDRCEAYYCMLRKFIMPEG